MFTGIVQALGSLAELRPTDGDMRLRVRTGALDLSDVVHGDSISVNGVCLTVTELPGDGFWADVSVETLNFTTLGELAPGDAVNLEKALTPSSRLGGHIVSGHVDGVGEIVSLAGDARSWRVRVRVPSGLARYIAHKGSVCVDGTSLTVNTVQGREFDLNIIPTTMRETRFREYRAGTRVNIEVDVVARYLERLLLAGDDSSADMGGLSLDKLAAFGYLPTGDGEHG